MLTSSDDVLLLLLLLLLPPLMSLPLRHDVEDVSFRPHFTLALHAPDDLLDVLLLLRAKSLPTPTLRVTRDLDDGRGMASSSC